MDASDELRLLREAVASLREYVTVEPRRGDQVCLFVGFPLGEGRYGMQPISSEAGDAFQRALDP